MSQFWAEIDSMFRELSERVAQRVEELARRIAEERGQTLKELAHRYGVFTALTVCHVDMNPLLTVPCLYVFVSREMSEERKKELIDNMYQEIAEWASDYRLLVKPIYSELKESIEPLISLY